MLERLQTQLDLALRNPSSRVDDDPFKDDLKIVFEDVTVAEWLLKIVNQTGAIVGPDGIPIETFDEVKKETTTKASSDIMGEILLEVSILSSAHLTVACDRLGRFQPRLHCQIPSLPRPLSQVYHLLSDDLPTSPSTQTPRTSLPRNLD